MGSGKNNPSTKTKRQAENNVANKNLQNKDIEDVAIDKVGHCPYDFCPKDKPTKINNLGSRCAYILIAWLVLGNAVPTGNGLYVSLALFSWPLFTDYLKFNADNLFRKIMKIIGCVHSGFWLLVGFVGSIGILRIEYINSKLCMKISETYIVHSSSGIPVSTVWFILGITIIIAILDWVAYESNIEKVLIKEYLA